nr:DNA-binding transcriptional regulator [Klebsiella pneumoniae]
MDHDAASTPGERKVWQEKIRQREADLKARGCCHDALSVLQKSAHARTSRYLSENVKQRYHQCTNIECSATFRTTEGIDEVIRPRRRKRRLSRSRSHPGTRKVQGCYSSPYRH